MKLRLIFEARPEYIRPLVLRIASDDGAIDKFAGIQDYEDIEQLQKLFKSWIKVVKEVKIYEQTIAPKISEPLSEMVGLPWDRHKRGSFTPKAEDKES